MHTYSLAAILNEKMARFTHQPVIQVTPNPTQDISDARRESSELETALNMAFYEMERNGDGDVWGRVLLDAISLDEGVERVERAPAAFWPELMAKDASGKRIFPFENANMLDSYKKLKGLPIRTVYVPLESYFPVYEGSTAVEAFQIETRTLRSVMRNKLFNTAELGPWASTDTQYQTRTKISIVMHDNGVVYSYWALPPVDQGNQWPTADPTMAVISNPVLLHAYKHDLGHLIYNSVAGRFGGWKTSTNRIEGANQGLLDLNQVADEVMSQVLTNIRARYWPTLVFEVDPDRRALPSGSPPKMNVKEGENITIFKDESIGPIFKTEHDEAVPWFLAQVEDKMSRLGGGPSLYGQRQPGVETGYHQNLQITQSEHLDEKIEQHASWGAVKRATLVLDHIKALKEFGKVYVNYIDDETKQRTGRYLSIDVKDLSPMPQLDAQVRKPRPVDLVANIRAARESTDDRGGRGPLLSDDTARAEILGREAPDFEERKILLEQQKRQLVASGAIAQRIGQLLNMMLVQESAPNIGPNEAAGADPALMQAITASGNAPATSQNSGTSDVPLQTGMPTGQSQPEAQVTNGATPQ